MKTVDFIRKLPFFESFNEEQLKVLVKYLEPKHFSSGDLLLKQGNRGNELSSSNMAQLKYPYSNPVILNGEWQTLKLETATEKSRCLPGISLRQVLQR